MNRNRSDFTPDTLTPEGAEAKQKTRQKTLDLIRESDYWVPDAGGGYLNGDWIELSGVNDPTLQMLLDANALRPGKGKYIGVNLDQALLDANAEHFKAATEAGLAEWVCDKWANVMSELGDGKDKGPRDQPCKRPDVRVVVFDGINSVANSHIEAIRRPSLNAAKRLYQDNGTVLLVMNFCLRGAKYGGKHVEDHRTTLVAWKNQLSPHSQTDLEMAPYCSQVVGMYIAYLPLGF